MKKTQFFLIDRLSLMVVDRCCLAMLLTVMSVPSLNAQTSVDVPDTLSLSPRCRQDSLVHEDFVERLTHTRWFQATFSGTALIVRGLLVKSEDRQFRQLRDTYAPHFHTKIDNYSQYLPAAVMFGLKASGVESRSSWSRMLLSDAVSMAMMTGVVQGLKHTTHVERPDGSNSNSFPSGHTATAFMTATMLTKEYGHLSPWVGVGAYTLATATGLMRIGNNKHWMSDVLVGAGVGLISTELSYWLVDAICKDRGLLRPGDDRPKPIDETRRPSFVGLYMGWNVPPGRVRVGEGLSYKASSGTTIGLEGAYFLNRYVGVGGRAALSNLQLEVDGVSSPDNMVDYTSLAVGPYFALPLGHRWSMGSKLLAGEVWYPETSLGSVIVARHHGLLFGTGLSLEYQLKNRMAGSLFVDDGFQIMPDSQNHGYLHTLAVGTKVAIRL